MTFPIKGTRSIIVNHSKYRWRVKGNDEGISLSISSEEGKGQVLITSFGYHHCALESFDKEGALIGYDLQQRFAVTPRIVKQIIEYGLLKGWNPIERSGQLDLGNLDKILSLQDTS